MKHSLTEMERTLLNEIPNDNFYEQGWDSCLWTRIFTEDTCSIDARKVRGVLSSLVKKGYIHIEQDPEEENEYCRSYFTIEEKLVDFFQTESEWNFDKNGSVIREPEMTPEEQVQADRQAAQRRVDELLAGLSFEERLILQETIKGGE